MKYAIVGIGGVGGVLGGLLVRGGKDVAFIARGENLKAIKEDGLRLESVLASGEYTAHPRIATDDAAEVGEVDCVILCTKVYGLETAIKAIAPLLREDTLIISTLNGVGNAKRIAAVGGKGIPVDGCMYIMSGLEGPGHVRQIGRVCRLVFGGRFDERTTARLKQVESDFNSSDMRGEYTQDIDIESWKKLVMITASACVQAYYDATSGEMMQDPEKMETLTAVINETAAVGRASGVKLPEDTEQALLKRFKAFDPEAVTSLQRDIKAGRQTELEYFGPYVIKLADELGVSVPVLRRVIAGLR